MKDFGLKKNNFGPIYKRLETGGSNYNYAKTADMGSRCTAFARAALLRVSPAPGERKKIFLSLSVSFFRSMPHPLVAPFSLRTGQQEQQQRWLLQESREEEGKRKRKRRRTRRERKRKERKARTRFLSVVS
ncbi:hypothetical protein AXF42_Ash012522 [Apostasia shenzhenica]|uniref:Uncharacterized protein n=1 Tax=Apostasia shenzhenica TaxID=1088818 RepID=A0A2I0AQZ8_9ASPA|nr:hypothetical protein AXF42_Ash012522 [Apostasia shenzhenica]